jgi:predicted DNA-binding protein
MAATASLVKLDIRTDPELRARIRRLAEESGESVSTVVRAVLRAGLPRVEASWALTQEERRTHA